MNDVIWIVVPVYNVEKLLAKCIKSVLRQTYTNWKLVLVDDGSTDRSGAMCDEYAQSNPRISVLHTPNAGSAAARISGIKLISDEGYCFFCDSDDELPENALELLFSEAIRSGVDLVCGNVQRICKGIRIPGRSHLSCFDAPRRYDRSEIQKDLYVCCFGGGRFPVSMWGKLCKSRIIRRIMLNMDGTPKFFGEDLNVSIHLLPELNSLSVINDVVYYYRIGGGTSKFMPTFLDDNLLLYHKKMDMADLCMSERNVRKLIAIEMKNIIVTYWIMCEKNRRYPHGSLMNEVTAVCELNEIKEALTMIEGSKSGLVELQEPLLNRDYERVCELIRKKVKKDKPRDLIKKLLMG